MNNARYYEITEDDGGHLWVGSDTPYLLKLEEGTEEYTVFDLSDQGPNNFVTSIIEDQKGRILFTTKYGLYHKTSNGIRKISGRNWPQLNEGTEGTIYAISQNHIAYWPNGKLDQPPKNYVDKTGVNQFHVQGHTFAFPDSSGTLQLQSIHLMGNDRKLIETTYGVFIFSEEESNWITYRQMGIPSVSSVSVLNNKVWVISRRGTYRIQMDGLEIAGMEKVTTTYDNAVLVDQEGSIWIGTANEGLRQLVLSPFEVRGEAEGLASDAMLAVLEDSQGHRWIGTNCEGLHQITPQGNRLFDGTDGITECVWALGETSDGRIWAADRYIVVSNPQRDRFQTAPFADQLPRIPYRALFEDDSGHLWIGSIGRGIARWDGDRLQFYTKADGLPSNRVRMFSQDQNQTLWMATEQGIAKITDTDKPDPQKLEAAGDYYYRAIMRDQRGLFWFGSYGGGITIYNPQTGDTTRVTTATGLAENTVSQVAEDQRGNIWLGGNQGIYFLPKRTVEQFLEGASQTLNPVAFDTDDGLRTAETSGGFQPSWQHTADGTILFSTINGSVKIQPSNFRENDYAPPVELEQVLVQNSPVGEAPPYSFSHSDRRIQFRFAVLSFKNPDEVHAEYRMAGFDSEWQQTEGNRQTTYTSLPPGDYTFQVRAVNAYGRWNETALSVPVSVSAPFWQQSWFIALAIALIGGGIYGGFRLRLRYLKNRSRELKKKVRERTTDLENEKQMVEEKNQVIARQNQQLEELNRMKDRFIAGISHEFRTPLTLIFGSLEMAEQKLKESNPQEIAEYLERIEAHSEKLRELIDQFLELSRLEAGMSVMHTSTHCLTKLSAGITAAFTSLAEQKQIAYNIDLPEDSVWIEGDRAKLEMAINNILKNAFKFTGEGGTISYTLTEEPDREQAVISISDTAQGIAPEEQDQIFERFYQAGNGDENQAGNPGGGTGIGLAVAHEIVELHEGSIALDSQPGVGSTFTITLPILDLNLTQEETTTLLKKMDPESEPEALEPESPQSPSKDAKQILVIEDNAELRTFIRRRLGDTYAIIEAGDGAEGLEQARQHLPDLIISDVMMPNMDGYTFCRKLREDHHIRFLPVILLTARAGKVDEITGLKAGADEYIQKPFDTRMLRARVDNLINLRLTLRKEFREQGLPKGLPLSDSENSFQNQVAAVLEDHLSDPDFSVEMLAEQMSVSRRQLLRKCKRNFDQSPNEYIRSMRLRLASRLLADQDKNISEVAYAVGFNNLSLFARYFKEWSGQSPSAYQESVQG